MSDPGALAPPPPPVDDDGSSPISGRAPRPSRHLRAIAATTVAVVVAVAAAGGLLAFRALHGSADTFVSMVPSDTAIYVGVNFDPPAGQKLAVAGLLNKFPGLGDRSRDATINGWLDTAFSGAGLTHNDITSWLGSQLSVALPASALSSLTPRLGLRSPSSPPSATVLIASRDNGKAQAALDKFRTGAVGRADTWTTTTHDGVTVTSGTGHGSGGAFAITNDTVILAGNGSAVDAVIDTAHGKRADLQSSGDFRTVNSELPADRLGMAYVDVPALIRQVSTSLGPMLGGRAQLSTVQAYHGVGVALVASSDGVALDGTEDYDASRLTPDQRSLLGIAAHPNGSLGFMPRTTYGLLAFTGLQQTLRSLLTTVAPTGSAIDMTLQQFGVTGSQGIVGHLIGDAGVEIDQTPGQTVPSGALIFDTDSTTAAQSFLDNLVSSICRQSSACGPARIVTQVDKGVTISSLPLAAAAGSGVEPSWAVSNGWAIIGSSPTEVRAALDSHTSGSAINTSPTYAAVAGHVATSNNGMFYLDVPAVVSAIRKVLPPGVRAAFDSREGPYVNRLGAVGLSEQNASGHITFTLFVLIR